jgi:hypothetical protein
MSEYQYYEFQATDQPLTDKEMQTLRSYSTRATITRTSFVNDYSWGSFKGDEDPALATGTSANSAWSWRQSARPTRASRLSLSVGARPV